MRQEHGEGRGERGVGVGVGVGGVEVGEPELIWRQ